MGSYRLDVGVERRDNEKTQRQHRGVCLSYVNDGTAIS